MSSPVLPLSPHQLSEMASADTQLQTTPKPGVPEQFMHKNRLQEYTQRSALPLPLYQTINEGTQHAPKFRASVLVDGTTYWSSQTFSNRKAAEQDVARLALEGISRKIKDEGCPIIRGDTVFCKSILNEFAVKMNLEKPTYITSQPEGLLPIFISSLAFNGISYIGGPGRSKREAEQLAARTVILSILGNSESRTLLSQIIKSKSKLYAALHYVNQPGASHDINVAYGGLENGAGSSLGSGSSRGIMPVTETSAVNSLGSGSGPGIIPVTGNSPRLSIIKCIEALPSGQPANAQVMLQPQPEFKKPKEEVNLEVRSGSERNVAAVTIEALATGSAGPPNVVSRLVDESQHVGHNAVPNQVPLSGPSALSVDSQAAAVDPDIGRKRASKNKKNNKSKKVRNEEH